jgi:hypothetical protein
MRTTNDQERKNWGAISQPTTLIIVFMKSILRLFFTIKYRINTG